MRNLSIPAAFVGSSAPGPSSLRPAYGRSAFSSFGATSAASAVGSSSGSSSLTERFPAYAPTQRSKDDLDLYIPSLHRRRSGRRKLTVSHGTRTASVISDGAVKDIDQPSSNGVPLGRRIDVKGKGRESNLASSRDTLNSIREAEQSAFAKSPGEQEVELDDSEVVFGWTSASRQPVPLQLQRSKSKSSLKSSSSKRSITSSVSKRFFRQNRRRRDSLVDTEDDDNEDSDDTEEHSPRKMTNAKYDRPTSPMSPHVSFQMSSDHTHAWSSGVDAAGDLPNSVSAASRRARSASRGSIFSVASGSSASTIRASAPFKHSEKEERFLRLKRYEDIRAHLVRSRLALCVPQAHSTDTGNTQNNLRPSMTRTRTISLPLRSHSAKDTMRSSPSTGAEGNPFYVSEPHKKSMEPSFPLDLSRTSLSLNAVDSASRCHRVIVQIWIESPLNPTYMDQGGKEAPWSLLLEWDVDLRRLISLGTDVSPCLMCCYQTRLILM